MAKSKSRKLADFISDSAIDTAELADGSITPAKLDSTGSYTVANLGIGTSSPLYNLHTKGSTQISATFESTGASSTISFINSGTTDANDDQIGTTTNDMWFRTNNNERMRINSSGNVGIGTSSPDNKLTVAGNITQLDGSPEYHFATSSSNHYNWRVAAQEVVGEGFEIASGTQTAGTNANSDTYTNRFVIKANTGNVGIGTNSPSANLDIAGNVIRVAGAKTYYNSAYMSNNQTYNFDITVPNEGGGGNSFLIECGYNHYYVSSYGAHRSAWVSSRGTNTSSISNYVNQTSTNAGSWDITKPNNTTLRITKNAGTYGGGGWGFVKVTFKG